MFFIKITPMDSNILNSKIDIDFSFIGNDISPPEIGQEIEPIK
jgi:hypothetical protein